MVSIRIGGVRGEATPPRTQYAALVALRPPGAYGSLMQRQSVCLCCDVASGVGLHVASVVWVVLLVLLYAERDLCEAGICILTWQISEFLDSDFYLVEIQIFT